VSEEKVRFPKPGLMAIVRNQLALLEMLDTLIAEDRGVRPEEREKWMQIVSYALLGFGTNTQRVMALKAEELGGTVDVRNVEEALRMLPYVRDVRDWRAIWRTLRADVLRIFPHVIREAFTITREIAVKEDRRPVGVAPKIVLEG